MLIKFLSYSSGLDKKMYVTMQINKSQLLHNVIDQTKEDIPCLTLSNVTVPNLFKSKLSYSKLTLP